MRTRSTSIKSCTSSASTASSRSRRPRQRQHVEVPSLSVRDKYLLKLGFDAHTLSAVPQDHERISSETASNSTTHTRAYSSQRQLVLPACQTTYTYNINSNCTKRNRRRRSTKPRHYAQQSDHLEDHKAKQMKQAPHSPTCVAITPEENSSLDGSEFNLLMNSVPEVEERQSPTQGVTATNNSGDNCKKTRHVSFDETVSVLTIPSKDAYSDRIRKYLWIEPHEMMQNTSRNAIEFASENWDWRQVAEDVEFFTCPETGEKIHPCHAYTLSYQYRQDSGGYYCHHHFISNSVGGSISSSSSSSSISNSHSHRSLNRHPFLAKSRQAAMAWQQSGGHTY